MRAGRLAVKWNEFDTGAENHLRLSAQTKAVWEAMHEVSRPAHVVPLGGHRPMTNKRVGRAARNRILARDLTLGRPGLWRGRLQERAQG
jgi:hypothetical protein